MNLFTNDDCSKLKNELRKSSETYKKISIASAFFSNSEIVKEFLNKNCEIQLIIRLNQGTSLTALREILGLRPKNIEIKFFTSEYFHPKFYIFDDKKCFIGSSNLTERGLNLNQEVNVCIFENETIKELLKIFNSYWKQAKTLTLKDLEKFEEIEEELKFDKKDNRFSEKLKSKIGDIKYDAKKENRKYMFYCTGSGEFRNFEDYIKYNFISAGQGKWYSDELRKLKKGDYFFAYEKEYGYVGVGLVVEEAKPIDEFVVEGYENKKIYELPIKQKGMKTNHENEKCEWLAKVKWIKTVPIKSGKKFPQIFNGCRHIVCNIDNERYEKTIDFLEKEFGL